MKALFIFIAIILTIGIVGGVGYYLGKHSFNIIVAYSDNEGGIYLPMKIGRAERCVKDGGILMVQEQSLAIKHEDTWPLGAEFVAVRDGNKLCVYENHHGVRRSIELTQLSSGDEVHLLVKEPVAPTVSPTTPVAPPATAPPPPPTVAPVAPPATK